MYISTIGATLASASTITVMLLLHTSPVRSWTTTPAHQGANFAGTRRRIALRAPVVDSSPSHSAIATSLRYSEDEASEWYVPPPKRETGPRLPAGVVPHIAALRTREELDEFLAQDDRLVVIKFYASWCKSCQKFGLLYEKLAVREGDWRRAETGELLVDAQNRPLRFGAVEYGRSTELCRSLGIERFPSVVFYQNSRKLNSLAVAPAQFYKVKEAARQLRDFSARDRDLIATMAKGEELIKNTNLQTPSSSSSSARMTNPVADETRPSADAQQQASAVE